MFSDELSAQTLVKHAKQLQESKDSYVKQSVYISRDLTKAETVAEYERRVTRRKQQTAKSSQSMET